MKKQLNISQITSELTGGSAFFPGYQKTTVSPTPQPEEPQNTPSSVPPKTEYVSPQNAEQQGADITPPLAKPTIPERSNARPPERIRGKRIITRNSFETYEDQMDALRKLAYREKMEGKIGSMSAMVREAIDDYLDKRSKEI
jgi:hypothetical protein